MKERFPSFAITASDREECYLALNNYEIMLSEKSICEGDCKRGDVCPTGVCRVEQKVALRRQASRDASLTSLSSICSKTRSCPASPRASKYASAAGSSRHYQHNHRQMDGYEVDELMELPSNTMRSTDRISSAGHAPAAMSHASSRMRSSISRSNSVVSNQSSAASANRYGAPRGLFSYTSSAPSSLRSSRIDLVPAGPSTRDLIGSSGKHGGSVSSIGSAAASHPKHGGAHSRSSSFSHNNTTTCNTASPVRNNPNGKPPPSPKRNIKRYNAT